MLAAGVAAMMLAGPALAAGWTDQGPDGGLLMRVARHNHHHKSGHDLLGERRKHDGRHEVDKVKGRSVKAEVKGGKVVNVDAQDLKVKRVKSTKKMAASGLMVPVAMNWPLQLAQLDEPQYGYCVDDGIDLTCYWFPADDVDYQDYSWEPYDPNY
jgi:hypothetical protein